MLATVINKNYWNGLPADVKSVMEGLSDDTLNYYLQKVTAANQEAINGMAGRGVHFYIWPPFEQAMAKSAVQPAQSNAWIAPIGGSAQGLIDKLKEKLLIYESQSTYQTGFDIWQAH